MSAARTRTRLGDVLRVKHGYAFSGMSASSDTALPVVVGIGNFDYAGGFRFGTTATKRYSGDYPSEFQLVPGDVLLAMTCQTSGGEILGIPGTIPDDGQVYLHNQRLGKVEVTDSEQVDLRFVFHLARSGRFNRHLFATASGSKILHTAPRRIEDFEIDLPPLGEQREAAAALDALDDKIESNRRVAKLSALLAQERFRLLVEGADDEWVAGTLRDILSLVKDPARAGQFPDRPYVPIDTLPMRSLGIDGFRANGDARSSLLRFEQNDVLIGAMRVYFHRVVLAPFAGLTRTTTFVLRPHDEAYLGYALLLCNEDSTIAHAQGTSKGSTMPYAVWDGGLADMAVRIPPRGVVVEFNATVMPLLSRVRDLYVEQTRLAALRDALLPELIFGRIRANQEAAAA